MLKAVLPVAGLGTRMLPATKEQPKEMLPVFWRASRGGVCVKPLIQLIFEQLYEVGVREFCFVVGRGKRIIEDHFTPDEGYLNLLIKRGKSVEAEELSLFYGKVRSSTVVWVNQEKPRGFGHAVLQAKAFVGGSPFLVHAGDTLVIGSGNGVDHIERLVEVFRAEEADAVFLLKEVEDPRMYGVVKLGDEVRDGVYKVESIVEKPKEPPSNYAVMPIYVFRPIILRALEVVEPGPRGEIELTDAISKLVEWGLKVYGVVMCESDVWLDIGTPENYWEALNISYRYTTASLPRKFA